VGTTYQNAAKPQFVVVTANANSGGNLLAYTDASSSPVTYVAGAANQNASAGAISVSFWVLANNYFKVNASGSYTITSWTEWY
jgi:hypothetical protein